MKKSLAEMTLEELWILFPIILKEHNDAYFQWYEEEKETILSVIDDREVTRINHIGSSAVKGLLSKPTIDILIEIKETANVERCINRLENHGWSVMSRQEKPYFQVSLCKGYTVTGFAKKVFHLHLRYPDDWGELYFRDYLIHNKEDANAYASLKEELMGKFKNNRDAYTHEKGDFVMACTEKARTLFAGRYQVK